MLKFLFGVGVLCQSLFLPLAINTNGFLSQILEISASHLTEADCTRFTRLVGVTINLILPPCIYTGIAASVDLVPP